MNSNNRINIIPGIIIVAIGILFLLLNLFTKPSMGTLWPLIFFLIAIGFYLPPLGWPQARENLSAFFIPGSIMAVLGLIFLYNTLTGDWLAWAYMWSLIPAGVGMGLTLAAFFGQWGDEATRVGFWMLTISLAVFSVICTLFGSPIFKIIGPVLLISGGLLLFLRSMRKTE